MSKDSNSKSEMSELKEQLEKAELELKLIELERKMTEGRKEIFSAKLLEGAPTPMEGKINLGERADLEARILTYKAIAEIASEIALEVGRIGSERVMIYTSSHLEEVAAYRSFIISIKLLCDEYEEALKIEGEVIAKIKGRGHDGHIEVKEYEHLIKEEAEKARALTASAAKTVISTVAPIALKSFLDIASLFKSDTSITFSEFNLVEEALFAEVASYLKRDGIEVINPNAIANPSKALLTALFDLKLLKVRAENRLNQLKDLGSALTERLVTLNKQCDSLVETLSSNKEGSGETFMEALLKAENIAAYIEQEGTDLLALKPVYAGGNNKVKRRLFSSRLLHNGGAIVTYLLCGPDGVVKSSKTFYNYTGYKRFKNPKLRMNELNNFESQQDKKRGLKLKRDQDEDFI